VRLEGKVALVTGSRQGIGAAIQDLFLAEGATVVGCDLDFEDEGTAEDRLLTRRLDVSDAERWLRVGTDIEEQFGRLDAIVNNAGIVGSYDPVETIEPDLWDLVLSVNLTGTFLGARTAIPLMRRAGGGSIVNISSIWGIIGAHGVAAYQASKGGVRTLTKNLALTYGRENIRANSIHPGIVDTQLVRAQPAEMNEQLVSATPLGRMAEPREIAQAALFLASDESSFVTGAELVVDGGYTIQ
jgi:NAD(P)-dependent dehydrogenase (short-subunit alcohol dehydrogenase family)